ncbi:MAG: hypothetical protein RI968_407 [Pseudomonadota bacterium]|jgi:hypothetical protein
MLDTSKRIALHGALLWLLGLPLGSAVYAHHGWSSYDQSQLLTHTGVIKTSSYEQPHGFVVLESQGRSLKVILAPPFRMESRGLSKEAIAPGREVTIQGYALRSNADELRAERITAGGKTIELR